MKTTDLRCYDNGGETVDRYTILPPGKRGLHSRLTPDGHALWEGIAADETPFHPQGFGQHIEAVAGPHLGARIPFDQLPAEVQRFARQAFSITD